MHVQEESCSFILGTYCSSWLPDDTGAPDVFGVKVLCPRQKAGGKSTAVLSGGPLTLWFVHPPRGRNLTSYFLTLSLSNLSLFLTHLFSFSHLFSVIHTHTHVPEKYRRLVSVDAWQHSMVSLSAVKSRIRTLKSMQLMLLISETFIVYVYIYILSLQKPKKDRNHTSACTQCPASVCASSL